MSIFSFFKKKNKTGLSYQRLETWVNDVMQKTIPDEVVAFCFNLYEDAGKSWTLELIGAASFDPEDSDWACDEVFSTRDNALTWHDDKEWQELLKMIEQFLKDYLANGKYGKALKERQGLAVGFVDGDLILL